MLLLFSSGIAGWLLFRKLRFPVPALLGTIIFIGVLKILQVPLPAPPPFLSLLTQTVLGLFVGSRVTRKTLRQLGQLALPAFIIVVWAVFIVFVFGPVLARITVLDLYTALLSSSIGGLPEMTMIAIAMGADVPVVIIMQTLRMVATIIAFPMMLKYWISPGNGQVSLRREQSSRMPETEVLPGEDDLFAAALPEEKKPGEEPALDRSQEKTLSRGSWWGLLSILAAALGGGLFFYAGIPAGAMVGAMFFVVLFSLAGAPVKVPPPVFFELLLVGVGIMVSANITPETGKVLLSGAVIIPAFILTVIIFLSSLLVAYFISRVVDWDFPTCFLAAAPGGFSVMTSLAIAYGKDPFRVSSLHLCRLLALKTIIPLIFWLLIRSS